jgi:carbon monoxide dehydrogenase subunit G
MFTVERKRSFDVPAERIRAVLTDVERLSQVMPRAEKVEVLARGENRARVAVVVRLGKFGTQRVEGEARISEDGVRFVAVQPMQIDVRWTIVPREAATDVIVRLNTEVPKAFGTMARLIPQRMIEERIGVELEGALTGLATLMVEGEA